MKKTIKKQFKFSSKEAQELQEKAQKACLTEAGLLRALIRGYEPREKPDERFYEAMSLLREVSDGLEKINSNTSAFSVIDKQLLEQEIQRLHVFEARIEEHFLKHGESQWQ